MSVEGGGQTLGVPPSPARSPYGDEEASLEEPPPTDDYELFRGATLQITGRGGDASGMTSRSPSTPGDYARLPLSEAVDVTLHQFKDGPGALRPAVSAGQDAVSPLGTTTSLPSTPTGKEQRRRSRRAQSPMPPANENDAREFFTYRDQLVQSAIQEVSSHLLAPTSPAEEEVPPTDRSIRGAWLLTEIDHWDHEKERLVLLGDVTLFVVKYDFIALRSLETKTIPLKSLDQIVQGELTYPEASLVPRLNGIAGGLATVVRDCLVRRVQDTVTSVASVTKGNRFRAAPGSSKTTDDIPDKNHSNLLTYSQSTNSPTQLLHLQQSQELSREPILSYFTYHNFEPRSRNVNGVRAMWNKGERLSFRQRWNPFSKNIPWVTFASHPLLWCKGGEANRLYDVDVFGIELTQALDDLHRTGGSDHSFQVEHRPIIIENYVGLTSLIHNTNDLGFFKVRGKVSF